MCCVGLMWSFPSSPRRNCLNHGFSLHDTQALMATTRNISLGNYLHFFFFFFFFLQAVRILKCLPHRGLGFPPWRLISFSGWQLLPWPGALIQHCLCLPHPRASDAAPGNERTRGAQGTVGTNRRSKKDQPCQGAHSGSPLFCVLTAPIMFLHSSQGICRYLFTCPSSCWTVHAAVLPSSASYSSCLEGCLTIFITTANTDSQALL